MRVLEELSVLYWAVSLYCMALPVASWLMLVSMIDLQYELIWTCGCSKILIFKMDDIHLLIQITLFSSVKRFVVTDFVVLSLFFLI